MIQKACSNCDNLDKRTIDAQFNTESTAIYLYFTQNKHSGNVLIGKKQ